MAWKPISLCSSLCSNQPSCARRFAHYFSSYYRSASVTTTPATLMGKAHRIGYLRKGYDAGLSPLLSQSFSSVLTLPFSPFDSDVVIWQSHPLQLGATPAQVFVDGIPQLSNPQLVSRPAADHDVPASADYTKEIADVISSHGNPYLEPARRAKNVVFVNVKNVVLREEGALKEVYSASSSLAGEGTRVVVTEGKVECVGVCALSAEEELGATMVDLKGGSIGPGLTSFG
jgi:hypothetical protein